MNLLRRARALASLPRRPLAAAWLVSAVVGGAAGCSDGYSTDGVARAGLDAEQSAEDIVASLNRMNRESLTSSRWRFTLLEPCELKLKAQRPDGSAEVVRLALRHSDVQVKGNMGGASHGVLVAYAGAPGLAQERLFEAPRWTDAVEYATQFHALQRTCSVDDSSSTG